MSHLFCVCLCYILNALFMKTPPKASRVTIVCSVLEEFFFIFYSKEKIEYFLKRYKMDDYVTH